MSHVNVNGVWRHNNSKVNVNGVWRDSKEWVNVNGVWRTSDNTQNISTDDIIGFNMVYTRIKDIYYDKFPDLKDNRKLPIQTHITSESPVNEFNDVKKSIVIEYSNEPPIGEGLWVYEGVLNLVLSDFSLFPISNIFDSVQMFEPNINVEVLGYSLCEPYGPAPMGWNRLFSSVDTLSENKNDYKKIISLNSYTILPTHRRSSTYGLRTLIGIARNMTDPYHNMVGSKGILDQTIDQILLNGEPMPFKITIYE